MTYSEFSFPNDTHIFWSLMIVTYPFITGIIAGAFIVSALYIVFHRKELWPIHRFSLLMSFAFLTCATLPLLNHLGHPERAFNVIITPNFRSAIAGFGLFYTFYFIILSLEIWFSYREDFINAYNKSKGWRKRFWGFLTLGVTESSPKSRLIDSKIIYLLSLIGIPAACTLHGYVGFLFGSLKSNPWWSTPLMPQIFLLSAIQSGLALLVLLYLLLGGVYILERSYECLKKLIFYLWFTMLLYIVSEGLELLYFYYESSDAWFAIYTLITQRIWFTFVILQVGMGVIIPFTIMTLMIFFRKWEYMFATMSAMVSVLALFEVWMMRWNVVIGGQLFSKSFVGFRSYHPEFLEKEGILSAIILTILPLIVLFILSQLLDIRPRDIEEEAVKKPRLGSWSRPPAEGAD